MRSTHHIVVDVAGERRSRSVALQGEVDEVRHVVHNEMLGAVAREFDAVHSVERARAVGSVDRIIALGCLRPELIAAIDRGLAATQAGLDEPVP